MELFESNENLDVDSAETEQSAQQALEQASAQDFTAGLHQTLGIDEPKVDATPPSANTENAKTLIAGMSEDELKAVLEKARQVDVLQERLTKTHDTAFGKIGHLEQQIRQLAAQTQEHSAQRPNQQLTKDSFSKLAAYMEDEDFAAALAEDLSALQLGGSAPAPQIDWDAINQSIDQRILHISSQFDTATDANNKEFEKKLLTIQHPDWKDIIAGDEYGAWKATLSPEAQETLDNSWDGTLLGNAFTKFKDWRNKKAENAQKKQQRLENAITPGRGGSGANQSANDDFNQGLKKVLGH